MSHRAKQILDAVAAKLAALPTTGANVFVSRAYVLDTAPALTIALGDDEPQQYLPGQIESLLTVVVSIYVKADGGQIDDVLLQIRREVHQALMADTTLGLPFVIDCLPGPMAEPQIHAEAETPTASADTTWRIRYRHSLTDPGA